jgi:hypothetical protein
MIGEVAVAVATPRPSRAPHDPGPNEDLPEGDPPVEDEGGDKDDEDEGETGEPPRYGCVAGPRSRASSGASR